MANLDTKSNPNRKKNTLVKVIENQNTPGLLLRLYVFRFLSKTSPLVMLSYKIYASIASAAIKRIRLGVVKVYRLLAGSQG